jgi:acetoin utilization deacetylase AcuC-like enzyme
VLREVLPPALAAFRPQLVLYNAGVDVHGDDSLGLLSLTDAGILARDRFVLEACAAAGAPVAAAIGGGYQRDHERIVDRHVLLHQAAAEALPRLAAAAGAAARAASGGGMPR